MSTEEEYLKDLTKYGTSISKLSQDGFTHIPIEEFYIGDPEIESLIQLCEKIQKSPKILIEERLRIQHILHKIFQFEHKNWDQKILKKYFMGECKDILYHLELTLALRK